MHEILHLLKAPQLVVYRQVPVTDQWHFTVGWGYSHIYEPFSYMTLKRVQM